MEFESKGNSKLTVDEMWGLVKKQDDWGVEGYEVPVNPMDFKQVKWLNERKKILEEHKRVWPPKDWPVDADKKPIKPKRPNYLDQVYKWSNSFCDPKKRDELMKTVKSLQPKQKDKIEINKRDEFLKYEEEKLKFREDRLKEEQNQAALKKQAFDEKAAKLGEGTVKSSEDKMKDKYKLFGSLPRCDRVTVVADAEHVGEHYPFYDTYQDPKEKENEQKEEEGDKKKNIKKGLFYPSVRIFLY
jgi:hypothetical protein